MSELRDDAWYEYMHAESWGLVSCNSMSRRSDLYALQRGELKRAWQPLGYSALQETLADWPIGLCWRLLSNRAREVIESVASISDGVTWAPEVVTTQAGEDSPYHVMILPTLPDLLDKSASTFGPGGPIRWVLRREAIEGRHVFSPAGDYTTTVVSGKVAKAFVEAGVTGGTFLPARVV